jgi:hypothetical protein
MSCVHWLEAGVRLELGSDSKWVSTMVVRNRNILWSWLLVLCVGASSAWAEVPVVNGTLDRLGAIPVLRVWGTPHEMGFAQGYLWADEIGAVLVEHLAPDGSQAARHQAMLTQLVPVIDISDPIRAELAGMIEGISARKGGSQPKVDALGRPITIDDLILLNAGDLIRAFGCSGFTVWGDRASSEGVITTRNFDYPSSRESLAWQVILVRAPQGKQKVATVTWPGYLGGVTGLNEAGVSTFMHDGSGEQSGRPFGRQTPVALTLTTLLESTDAAAAHREAERLLKHNAPYPFSYMIRVVTPRVAGAVEAPETVFRIDASGLGRNSAGETTCITTNHYLDGASELDEQTGGWSVTRYRRIEGRIADTVTAQSAWETQHAVSVSQPEYGTLHAVVIYPERRRLDIAFATWDGKIVSATASKPTTITFDALFGVD